MPLPGWFTHAASFCVGATAAAAGVLIQSSQTSRTKKSDDASSSRNVMEDDGDQKEHTLAGFSSSKSMKMLPTMPIRVFQPNDNLTIAFDTRNKNPLFVMERLAGHSSTPEKASRKNKSFHEESSLLPYHRSRNSNYRHSGYDRGHLAPAADFPLNDQEMNDTFVLTNISPQLPRFNRSIWLRLEEFVRKVAEREGSEQNSEIWVITGPLWLPSSTNKTESGGDSFQYSYEGIGKPPSLVAVPTHFYKVLAVVEKKPRTQSTRSGSDGSPTDSRGDGDEDDMVLKKFAAFVLPNSDSDGENNEIRLIDHTVRLTDLEAVTGLEFFPALFGIYVNNSGANSANDIPLRKEIADALTDDVRFHAKKRIESKGQNNDNANALVPSWGSGELSKGRQKKVNQVLRSNTPLPFQHLCRKNEACLKLLRV